MTWGSKRAVDLAGSTALRVSWPALPGRPCLAGPAWPALPG